jgi:hypothetical protein
MGQSYVGKLCTTSPSPLGALMVKHDATCSDMMKISLENIEVNPEEWAEFLRRLKESGQTLAEYFTYAVNDEIENALYHDPRLLEPVHPE